MGETVEITASAAVTPDFKLGEQIGRKHGLREALELIEEELEELIGKEQLEQLKQPEWAGEPDREALPFISLWQKIEAKLDA